MRVTWLGHACILAQTNQGNLLTDPWLIDPCLYQIVVHVCPPAIAASSLPNIDVICITHTHYDHFDPRTLQHLPKSARVVIPPSPARRLKQKLENLGFTDVLEVPDWQTVEVCGFQVTPIPSAGIPEECGFIVCAEGSTFFHAADSLYAPHSKRLQQFDIDVAFVPFTGWDLSGVLGINPDRQWHPDWEETAKATVSTGARYLVPSSCDQFWAPPSLQWLNDNIHPGTVEDFVQSIQQYCAAHPEINTEAIALTPGSTWSQQAGFQIAPPPQEAMAIADPPPPLRSIPLQEVLTSADAFVARRRPQILACMKQGVTYVYGVLLLLLSRYTFYLPDIDQYLRMHLVRPRGIFPVDKPVAKAPIINLSSQDAHDLFAGRMDIEMLVMASKIKLTGRTTAQNLIFVYALEYLFVKDDYRDLLSEENSETRQPALV